jgi:hypothetical protein
VSYVQVIVGPTNAADDSVKEKAGYAPLVQRLLNRPIYVHALFRLAVGHLVKERDAIGLRP